METFKIVCLLFMIFVLYQIYQLNCVVYKEGFEGTTQSLNGIDDTNAINTLAQIAKNLMQGGQNIPGNMTVDGTFGIKGNVNLNSTLTVKGTTNLDSGLTVKGRDILAELDKCVRYDDELQIQRTLDNLYGNLTSPVGKCSKSSILKIKRIDHGWGTMKLQWNQNGGRGAFGEPIGRMVEVVTPGNNCAESDGF